MNSATRLFLAPLAGGLAAGTTDFVAASLISGAPLAAVAKYISRGWLGKEGAAAAGDQAVLIGLASHFAIALVAALIYLLLSRRFAILARRPILCGAAFGFLVFGFMHLVVLPLSAIGAMGWPKTPRSFLLDMASNMFFGVIIAHAVAWIAPRRPS